MFRHRYKFTGIQVSSTNSVDLLISDYIIGIIGGGKKKCITSFLKKTNKTPDTELERAKRYRTDWRNRKGD